MENIVSELKEMIKEYPTLPIEINLEGNDVVIPSTILQSKKDEALIFPTIDEGGADVFKESLQILDCNDAKLRVYYKFVLYKITSIDHIDFDGNNIIELYAEKINNIISHL